MIHPSATRRSVLAGALALGVASRASAVETASRPSEVWLVRHAESEINVAPPPAVGQPMLRDEAVRFPLTVKGLQQAKALANRLVGQPPSAIYSSTRLRAIQTATAISLTSEIPLRTADELVEVDTGTVSVLAPDGFLAVYRRWFDPGDSDARPTGGESAREALSRSLPVVRAAIEQHRDQAGPLVFVTHGALTALIAPALFANLPHDIGIRHPLPNAGVVRGAWSGNVLSCVEWPGALL